MAKKYKPISVDTKKVLIIGGFWPYRCGSRRIYDLVRHLPALGWEPIVLTPRLDRQPNIDCRFIETGYKSFVGSSKQDLGNQLKEKYKDVKGKKFYKFCFNLVKEVFAYPDEDKKWKKFALEEAEKLIKKEKIDAIISVWPETSHLIAKELKRRHNIPWIADFPDLWSQNCAYPYGFIRKIIDRRLEKKTIKEANILTAISHCWAESLQKLHKDKEIVFITHGYDEPSNEPVELSKKFNILYTGIFYDGMRDLKKVLDAIDYLIDNKIMDKNDVEVQIYGTDTNYPKLEGVTKHYGVISREECLQKQREAQVLLMLKWEDPKDRGVYSGKIFEYLAAKRPILATGGYDDVVSDLIYETGTGLEAKSVNDIQLAILKMYSEFKTDGQVLYGCKQSAVELYSLEKTIGQFANLLNNL